jgi:hypothetical protein
VTISADELARVRYWVPESWEPSELFDDAAVSAAWNREADTTATTTAAAALAQSWANVYRVAYDLTQVMISGLIGQPDSFSVGGEYSESRGAAINLLLNRFNELKALRDTAVAEAAGTNKVLVYSYCRANSYGR